jgi:signal transduction histidine kinase
LPLDLRTAGPVVDVSPEATAVVVRVLTEALTNVERHAQASNVEVRLQVEDDRLTLTVSDDGVGFVVDEASGPGEGHFGLTLMRERARSVGGSLAVTSGSRAGAGVTLQVPVS